MVKFNVAEATSMAGHASFILQATQLLLSNKIAVSSFQEAP